MTEEITNKQILDEILKSKTDLQNVVLATETRILLKLEEANNKISKLEHENNELKHKISQLENRNRELFSLDVIFGLDIPNSTLSPKLICTQLEEKIGVQLSPQEINNTYCIGKTTDAPIKVEFTCFWRKIEVLKNCSKLKGTGISISRDLSLEQRRQGKILRNYLKKVRGENSNSEAYIKGDKLYIGGEIFTADQVEADTLLNDETRSEPTTPNSILELNTNPLESEKTVENHKTKVRQVKDKQTLNQKNLRPRPGTASQN